MYVYYIYMYVIYIYNISNPRQVLTSEHRTGRMSARAAGVQLQGSVPFLGRA